MPEPNPPSTTEAELAALADGSLDPARAEAVLARVAQDPRLAAELERQRAAITAISAAASAVSAPPALRARVDELQRDLATERARARSRTRGPLGLGARGPRASIPERSRARSRTRGGPLGIRAGGPRALIPASGLALAACVAVALVIALGGGGATVDSVLAVATRPPAGVAAIGVPGGPLLDEDIEGVRFPNYAAKFGWRPDGVRRDEVDGRLTRTVFYRRAGRRIAYTVVTGDVLRRPDGARAQRREGVALLALRRGDRTVVVWNRQAHTCVLSGEGVSAAVLLELASWKGRGQVRF